MRPIGLWLGVPACDEELMIGWCLDALSRARLPEGTSWREWLVVDDGSTDATAAVVRGWARAHPETPVSVLSSSERGGKSLALERVRQWFLERVEADDVLVVADADVEVDEAALVRLLTPFRQDPELAVAWGTSRARPGGRRRRASRFQLELVRRMAEEAGPCAVRVEGRLVALRPQRLPGFAWRSGAVVDDLQLAEHVRRTRVRARSVPDAWVWVTPASSLRDFSQTHRFSETERVAAMSTKRGRTPVQERAKHGLAVWHSARADPFGASAYLAARLASVVIGRSSEERDLVCWSPALATKVRYPVTRKDITRAQTKIDLLVKSVLRVRNWPSFLAKYQVGKVFGGERELMLELRDGTRLAGLSSGLASWPVFEVLLGDAYRLNLVAHQGLRDVAWVDIGSHIGSAVLAAKRALGVRRALCVEPSAVSSKLLRRNLAANGVTAEVMEAAVGSSPGEAFLVETTPGSCENEVVGQENGVVPGSRVVPVVPLGSLLQSVPERPLVVKMDCEGGEWAVLEGVTTSDLAEVAALLIEYHPAPNAKGWPWLVERLVAAGLHPLWHEPDRSRPGLGMAAFVRL